jgi:PAS domain-containing protein
MFESAPIFLWLEDYSALKILFDQWRAQGVTDLAAHLALNPGHMKQCAGSLKVRKVNHKTLQVFGAANQQELVARLPEVFRDDMLEQMLPELVALRDGLAAFSTQTVNYGLDGRRIDVQIHVRILQGHEDSWDRVLVSLEDITQSVKAREQLVHSERYARSLFDLSPVSLWVEDFSSRDRPMRWATHCCQPARKIAVKTPLRTRPPSPTSTGNGDRYQDRGLPFSGSYKGWYPTASTLTG